MQAGRGRPPDSGLNQEPRPQGKLPRAPRIFVEEHQGVKLFMPLTLEPGLKTLQGGLVSVRAAVRRAVPDMGHKLACDNTLVHGLEPPVLDSAKSM